MHGIQRPLSPYWIYRWEITMWLSSLHRITGLMLSLGAVALAVWLIALAMGADSFDAVARVYGAGWFKVPLVGWTFCFFYHLSNGVRHLAWDAGYGFELRHAYRSGYAVLAATVVLTVLTWTYVLFA